MDNLSVQEAADALGVSPATIRRRIKAGELRATKQPRPQGYEWRVHLSAPDQTRADHMPPASAAPSADQVSPEIDQVLPRDQYVPASVHLALQQQNLQLAGRIGWLESQLQHANERIRQLEAPKEPEEEPQPEPTPEPEPRGGWRAWLRRRLQR